MWIRRRTEPACLLSLLEVPVVLAFSEVRLPRTSLGSYTTGSLDTVTFWKEEAAHSAGFIANDTWLEKYSRNGNVHHRQ